MERYKTNSTKLLYGSVNPSVILIGYNSKTRSYFDKRLWETIFLISILRLNTHKKTIFLFKKNVLSFSIT